MSIISLYNRFLEIENNPSSLGIEKFNIRQQINIELDNLRKTHTEKEVDDIIKKELSFHNRLNTGYEDWFDFYFATQHNII